MAGLNGYDLSLKLQKVRRRFPLTAIEQALYHELVSICNDDDWAEIFTCSNEELYNALRIAENTLKEARNRLIQAGLIFYQSGKSKRQFSKYSFVKSLTTSTIDPNPATNAATNGDPNADPNPATNAADTIKRKPKLNRKISSSTKAPPANPMLEDVIAYFNENGYSEDHAKRAFRHYNDAGWKDRNGKLVLNWKQKMNSVWFTEEGRKKAVNGYKPAIAPIKNEW